VVGGDRTVRASAGPMFRALRRLLERGIFDPAQLTLRLFNPNEMPDRREALGVTEPRRPPVRRRQPRPRPPAAPPEAPQVETVPPAGTGRPAVRTRRARGPEEDDATVVAKLVAQHAEYNASRFGGALGVVPIAVSRRMRSRLGYYRLANKTLPAMIMISRGHLRRHGWEEVFQTLLHEMVHQWQAESGQPADHGPQFRAKARAVGAVPRARRPVGKG
jgi:SprT-like family